MLDTITVLAHSIHSNKGVYALILGSGISRSAGIPTGWEITLDLVRRVAVLEGEDAGADPAIWLQERKGVTADYSSLVDSLATTPEQRRAVLSTYIEATQQDRVEGLKMPTPAHRAIAELVLRGHIRVIVTTNFDRLLETAIRDAGVEPTVIATDDAIRGAIPLTHSNCTIVKVHGDYLDSRIKNTESELSIYSPELRGLIDRILDEFGLVVCGWSATWDVALRDSLVGSPSRRYPTFWAAHGEATVEAQDVIGHRGAQIIPISSADDFFSQLNEKIRALEEFSQPHPLSTALAISMTKRYLVDASAMIKLNDLVEDLVGDAIVRIPENMLDGNQWSVEEFVRRLNGYGAAVGSLIPVMGLGGRWSEERDQHLWIGVVERLYGLKTPMGGFTGALDFRAYPALLAFYSVGIGAVVGQRYSLLDRLLKATIRRENKSILLSDALGVYGIVSGDLQKHVPGQSGKKTPMSRHLAGLLGEMLPRDVTSADFEFAFDTFEVLVAMEDLDRSFPGPIPGPDGLHGVPVGRYIWRRGVFDRMTDEVNSRDGAVWVRGGMFGGNGPRVLDLLSALKAFSERWGGWE